VLGALAGAAQRACRGAGERVGVVVLVGLVALGAAPAARAESDRAAARDVGRAAQQLYAAVGAQRQVVESGATGSRATRCARMRWCIVPIKGGAYEAAWELVLPYEADALGGDQRQAAALRPGGAAPRRAGGAWARDGSGRHLCAVAGVAARRVSGTGRAVVDRAAGRLRALDASKRTVQRFTGDTDVLYTGWDLDNEVTIGGAPG
jgi:hypothetical protein